MSKADSQLRYALRRTRERLDARITREDHSRLGSMIRDGKGCFVERQSNRITVWLMEYNGEFFRTVYDKLRHQIVTFMYPVEGDEERYDRWKKRREMLEALKQN